MRAIETKNDLTAATPDAVSVACPFCQSTEGQTKAGRNRSGTYRYECATCQRRYTPAPGARGYTEDIRRQAAEAFATGVPVRRIARMLGINHQTVANWTRKQEVLLSDSSVTSSSLDREGTETDAPSPSDTEIGSAGTPPKQRTTIEDVARRAGVAASTISNYLNDKGRMSAETRERIRSAIDDLHFTPNALVRAIRARRTRILGVLLFDMEHADEEIDHSVTIPLLAGIYAAADAARHDILLYTGWPKRPDRNSGMDFLNGHVDGLLWAVPVIDAPALARVAAAGLPVVTMLSRHVPSNVGYVNGDNEAAAITLIRHLVEQGHRRIAFAGPGWGSSNYEDRRAGYRQGLLQAGLPYDEALARAAPSLRRREGLYQPLLEGWMRLPDPPTAIMGANDIWAESIGQAAQAMGLRIPQDISVTGFDDLVAAQTMFGGLTTIHQPFREIGMRAVERLIRLVEGAPVESCRLTLPLPLTVRHSTRTISL